MHRGSSGRERLPRPATWLPRASLPLSSAGPFGASGSCVMWPSCPLGQFPVCMVEAELPPAVCPQTHGGCFHLGKIPRRHAARHAHRSCPRPHSSLPLQGQPQTGPPAGQPRAPGSRREPSAGQPEQAPGHLFNTFASQVSFFISKKVPCLSLKAAVTIM